MDLGRWIWGAGLRFVLGLSPVGDFFWSRLRIWVFFFFFLLWTGGGGGCLCCVVVVIYYFIVVEILLFYCSRNIILL